MPEKYTVKIEKDEDGWFVSEVAELPGCHTQARTVSQLLERTGEAIEAYLGAGNKPELKPEFVKEMKAIEKQKSIHVRDFAKRYLLDSSK